MPCVWLGGAGKGTHNGWLNIGECPLAAIRPGTGLVLGYTSVGLGEWLIIGDGYVAYEGRMLGVGGGSEYWKLGCRATGPPADDGESGVDRWGAVFGVDDGTCWNARVTSCRDIRDGAAELVGGGVSPSSDFTSCSVNGSPVRSSAMPSRELTGCTGSLSEACDQTALRCSGSGARAGESLTG